jgi:amino acid adenylation domain-containing protein
MREIVDLYPLSPMQQGMVFHSLIAPESGVYVELMSCVLRGDLDVAAFENAWRKVIERHPILRTAFVWEDVDEPLQAVFAEVAFGVERMDWRELTGREQAEQLDIYLQREQRRGFDLAEAPLMRLALMRTGDEEWRFVWAHHHALLDGWATPLLLGEVFAFYEAFRAGQSLELPPARPYRDYIAWLQEQDLAAAEAWWQCLLAGFSAPTPLVVGQSGQSSQSETTAGAGYLKQGVSLSTETTEALDAFARKSNLTMNTIAQGAWATLLSRYSGEDDVVFGVTVSGRPAELAGSESMIGLFINTLPLRAQIEDRITTRELLQRLQAQQIEARQYEFTPLAQIQGWSDTPRGTPLFESILVYENYPVDESEGQRPGGLVVDEMGSVELTNYPLTVVVSPGRELRIEITYDAAQFDAAAIERMLDHVKNLLEAIAVNPDQHPARLPMLSEAERWELLHDWNQTETAYPAHACAHHLFEEQVERSPEAVAVEFAGRKLTYRELNQRANQLARWLINAGVGTETLVGLSVERSFEMVIGVLGVMKAGGAYVPIDPSYPLERLSFMLEDAKVSILLTQESLKERLPASQARMVCLDADWAEIARMEETNPIAETRPENLAYVIYTSGSTGKPKGTLIEHRGVVNYLSWAIKAYRVAEGAGSITHSSISFDLTVTSLFAPLLAGKRVLLAREDQGVEALGEAMRETSDLSLIKITPAHLELLGHQLKAEETAGRTRAFIIGGENLLPEHIAFWQENAPETLLINEYGPTETVVGCCVYEAQRGAAYSGPLPIGRPIANTKLFVLDKHQQPVPVGVPGELYIGGAGVGRGYLNRPELTAAAFVELKIGEETIRAYRTGDLVRRLPSGDLQCLGRMDEQVKIRGYRVELGEIESALKGCEGVKDAAVIAREEGRGDRRLVAYVVAESGRELNVSELKRRLEEQLPEYMLPAAYVRLEEIPLTANGKVDRRTLPAPSGERMDGEKEYVAPRTPVEELLAGIWEQVLEVERIGVEDNFFALGGHSLLATQLVSRARDAFAVELPLKSVFDNPTVAGMAAQVEALSIGGSSVSAPPIEMARRDDELPLSFSQQRLWFLDQLEPGSAFYNNPIALRLLGELDVDALRRSLNAIVARHESLRTRFISRGGRPAQVIEPELRLELPMDDISHLPASEVMTEAQRLATEEAQRPFDLAQGPLARARLLRLSETDHVLLVTLHHIISDGWSLGVLIRETAAFYQAFIAGAEARLPELPIQYADYARWQRDYLQGEALQRQLDYWTTQLRGKPTLLELPTDHPRPAIQSSRGATWSFDLPLPLSKSLARLSRQEGATLFMTLMAAFQTLLGRYSGQTSINVGTPIATRTRAELEGLIGFFAGTLVMRGELEGDPSFVELLSRARESALGAYAHQDLPFEQLVEALAPERDLSHTPLFQVMFVFDNAPLGEIKLPGLSLAPFQTDSGTARFDLTLVMTEAPDGLSGTFEYNTDLFEPATIERMAGHFQTLLESVVADPEQRLSQLPVMAEAERRQILVEWNQTTADFPSDRCFHHLFEERVAAQPDQVAASFEGQRLTYRELNERANQLAHYLRKQGVGPETIVGLCVERSLEMVIAQLGVMKAGAAYLPLDPNYPVERLAFMFEDSWASVLLTQSHLAGRAPGQSARVIELDREWERIAEESVGNPDVEMGPENLAYVIYTSGSTGRPKGTLLEHRGLLNLAAAQQRAFNLGAGKRVLQFSPFSFDASVWEMAMALSSGAELVLARQETLTSLHDLHRLLRSAAVTTVTLPPSVLRLLPNEGLPALETVIAAGERCTREIVARWSPGRKLFNAYGPTETTVCATMALCDAASIEAGDDPPIGRPLPNTQLFVLDKQGQPVPVGAPGELYIGGVCLAREYLRQPELTAARFVELRIAECGMRNEGHSTPWSESEGKGSQVGRSAIRNPQSAIRVYRTGDRVRYRADGNLEYLGRLDEQVKLRGYRIELGEVETALRQHSAVREAAVAVREDTPGDQRLVGYIVAEGDAPDAAGLRAHLRDILPEFMTPSVFVTLERLPLSPSGKVDRAALPAPDASRPDLARQYVAPRTEDEKRLVELWAELLGVERVGVEDNFFELGGHSLLATQLISRARDEMQVELPLRALFESPTPAGLALAVEQTRRAGAAEPPGAIVAQSREARRVKRSALK